MGKPIELRSDTTTKPSKGMREAMARAEVGDDVFGEDPTVNRLQEMVAELLGKEAALFVPSGTMANQIAIKSHTQHGDEIIMERYAHPFNSEAGALAALCGVQVNLIDGVRGVITVDQVKQAVRSPNVHHAPTRLICLENTHNRGGGKVYPLEIIAEIRKFSLESGIPMHLDGARLMNASVASGIKASDYTAHFDSCTICLSKGLGAPVGSLVAGSRDFIAKAYRYRKMFGGGMRQVGILAAAGIYALEHNIERLKEDHENAKRLAKGIEGVPGISINADEVETNLVYFTVTKKGWTARQAADALKKEGVLVSVPGTQMIRAVTHLDVSRQDIEEAIEIIQKVFQA